MPIPPLVIAGAWLWKEYGKSVIDKAAGGLKEQWKRFKWNDAAENYRKRIKKLYGTMQIMGMAKPVPLDDIFTDAYMLDKPTASGRFDIERLKQVAAEWNKFSDKLRTLLMKHRDIGYDWHLTGTQEALLADYVSATRLLQDCLELAFMPPDEKKVMLNSLYLPPAQAKDVQND